MRGCGRSGAQRYGTTAARLGSLFSSCTAAALASGKQSSTYPEARSTNVGGPYLWAVLGSHPTIQSARHKRGERKQTNYSVDYRRSTLTLQLALSSLSTQ